MNGIEKCNNFVLQFTIADIHKLTEIQKARLSVLEPKLRNAVKMSDYPKAKEITQEIQSLLRPTGHETRLMQAKNWLFEAAMEAGEIETAISGFKGIRLAVSSNTRIYIEATALLAICYIRKGEIENSKLLISQVLSNEKVIKSEKRRRQFRINTVQRFEEEATLSSFKNKYTEGLNPEELQEAAGKLVQTENEDQIFTMIGLNTPGPTKVVILNINEFTRKQIPTLEQKFLPSPEERIENEQVGKTVFSSIKRIIYKSLCDPNSDIYKSWFHEGLGFVLNKKYIGTAVASCLLDYGIGIKMVAIPVVALIIKFGIEVYCDRYKPTGIMIDKRD